jgi:hypothetical protein
LLHCQTSTMGPATELTAPVAAVTADSPARTGPPSPQLARKTSSPATPTPPFVLRNVHPPIDVTLPAGAGCYTKSVVALTLAA